MIILKELIKVLQCFLLDFNIVILYKFAESINQLDELRTLSRFYYVGVCLDPIQDVVCCLKSRVPITSVDQQHQLLELFHQVRVDGF